MTVSPLLTVNQLSRAGRSGEPLLVEIGLTVSPGERWAVAGPSGAGKTLLMRSLAYLDVFQGELLWCGAPVLPSSVPDYRSKVVYLAQASPVIEGTVEDNLRLPFQLKRYSGREWSNSQAIEWCRRLGKQENFLQRSSADLSGGEKQVVALLRVLPLEAQILLLDEATSALDAATEKKFEALVEEWLTERPADRAVVWVSHDEEQRQRVSSLCLQLEHGRMAEDAA